MILLLFARLIQEEVPEKPHWEAWVRYELQSFSQDRTDWHTLAAGARHKFDGGSLALEALSSRRFDEWDSAIALDGWHDLWKGAFGNVRVQAALEPAVLPDLDAMAEIYQALGSGWELSGSYRTLNVPGDDVRILGASVGKYVGDWYWRARASLAPSEGEVAVSGALSGRYFFEAPDDFVEVGGGWGEEIVLAGADGRVEKHPGFFAHGRFQKYFTGTLGLTLSINYSDYDGIPTGAGGTIGILVRW